MAEFFVRSLTEETWAAFARLVEKHNGVWGGCWCTGFHQKPCANNRLEKENRVRQGRTHAALVFHQEVAVGWCQFGSAEELPRIKHRKEYEKGPDARPDWRITCFFVDKEYRKQGVASIALIGALDEIAKLGGGVVESYPEDVSGRTTSSSFIYNSTVSMFERQGFERSRRLGMHHWVMTKVVEPR